MDCKPLISIITPVYNAERFIRKTVESVQKQTEKNFELILVDDDSRDETVRVIEKLIEETGDTRIRLYINDGEKCAAGARNKGLKMAQGRYITYIDADDLWEPSKLERQISFMEEKKAAFSFTSYEFTDEDGISLGKIARVPETLNYRQALTRTTIFTSTVMFDTTLINKNELYMPIVKSEDTALWWRILKSGVTAYGLDEILVKYRRVGVTLSSNKINAVKRIWNLYRNVEGFGAGKSAGLFVVWTFRTVARRGLK